MFGCNSAVYSQNVSSGFGGGNTRSMGKLEREVETKLKRKRLDVFTDEFNPPYSREIGPGQDVRKDPRNGKGYQKPHDDEAKPNLKNPVRMGYAGKASDQWNLDLLDKQVQQYEAQIKSPKEQFPGSTLKAEVKKDFGMSRARLVGDVHRRKR